MSLLVKNICFSMRVSLTLLRFAGFWPPNTLMGNKLLLYNFYGFVFFMLLLGVFFITEVGDLCVVWGNLPLMTGTIFILFTNLAHAPKFVNIALRRKSIVKIVTDCNNALIAEKSIVGQHIVKSCNRETKWQLFIYYLLSIVTSFGWATSAEKHKLPLPGWYPFNVNTSPTHEITYIYQVLSIYLAAGMNISKDTLVTVLIAQCRCRLRLIGLSLRNLCHDSHFITDDCRGKIVEQSMLLTPSQEKAVKKRLINCVIQHQNVLETALLLQNSFSEPTFIQFNISLVIICATAFQLTSQTSSLMRFISMGTFLVNMMYQVFIYCYQGDQLTAASEELAGSVYEMPWYSCSVRLRRSLLIVMVRCRRITKFTAGGFTILSLSSFMAVLKTSYSLFTLLQQVTE